MQKKLSVIIVSIIFAGMLFAQGSDFTHVSYSEQPVFQAQTSPAVTPVAQSETRPVVRKRKIDFMADQVRPFYRGKDSIVYFTGNFAAHHNGAVISCDSAVRFNDSRWGFYSKVIINQDSIYIYGDSAIYDGNISLAEVYAPIVKVVDGDALLYTYNFTFNTATKIGRYTDGGVLVQDNDILESYFGYYYADTHDIICVDQVEIHGSDYDLKSDSVIYNTETKFAQFFTNSEIWNIDGDYLSAQEGTYDQNLNVYTVTRDGYILTAEQEIWGDTLIYDRANEHITARRNIQMDDFENKVVAMGDYGEYWKADERAFLTKQPIAISYDTIESDSVFVRADTMWLETRNREADKRAEVIRAREDSIRMVEERRLKAEQEAQARAAAKAESEAREKAMAEEAAKAKAEAESKAGAEADAATNVAEQAVPTPEKEAEAIEILERKHQEATQAKAAEQTTTESVSGDITPTMQVAPSEQDNASGDNAAAPTTDNTVQTVDTLSQATTSDATVEQAAQSDSVKVEEQVAEKKDKRKARREKRSRRDKKAESEQQVADSIVDGQVVTDTIPAEERARLDSVAMKLALDSIVNDSLFPDSILSPIQLQKRIERREAEAKAEALRLKAEERKMFLDSIAKKRQAKMIAQYEKERAYELRQYQKDSIRRAQKRAKRIARGKDVSELDMQDSLDAIKMNELRKEIVIDTTATEEIEEFDEAPVTDSLVTDSLPQDSIYRLIKAYRNVRIFRSDAQAVCDSMVGNSTDSVMRMYIEPVLWNNLNQIAATQVDMYTKNQQIERVEFLENPIMIAEIDTVYYNQVTGKKMIAFFRDNDIYRNDVEGNVQTIYFQQESEESKIVTDLIYLESASASFYLENQELKGITYRNDVPFTIYPLALVPPSQPTRLPNFKWVPELRPDRESIFDGEIRPSMRERSNSRKRPTFRIVNRMDRDKERLLRRGVWSDREDELKPEIVEWRNSREK